MQFILTQFAPCCRQLVFAVKVAAVYLILFLCLYPVLYHHMRFSKLYEPKVDVTWENVIEINYQRRIRANSFLKTQNPSETKEMYLKNSKSLNLRLVVGVITRSRKAGQLKMHSQSEYLTQVMSRLHEVLGSSRDANNVFLFICNTDPEPDKYAEANRMATYFPHIAKVDSAKAEADDLSARKTKFVGEGQDYAFCLQSAFKYMPKYVLLLQDDAYPHEDFHDILDSVLRTKLETRIQRGELVAGTKDWAWLKLCVPYYLNDFHRDPFVICQWVALTCAIAGLPTLAFHIYYECIDLKSYTRGILRHKYEMMFRAYLVFLVSFLCIFAIIWTIGRPYYLKLHRFSQNFYTLEPGTSCCLPAVLYPFDNIEGIMDFLTHASTGKLKQMPLDWALDVYRQQTGLRQYLLTPNIFTHIGFYSTLNSRSYRDRAFAYEYVND